MRKLLVVTLLCGLAFLPAGCQQKSGKRKVAISVLTMNNPFFKEIADVFKEEMEKNAYDVIVTDPREDVVEQTKQVEAFLQQKVSAIVLCPCKAKDIGAAIRQANKAGVPVFTADLATLDPDAKVVCHIATDNYAGGRHAGEAMIEALGPKGGKVLLLDMPDMESCMLRVKGFKEVLNDYNSKRTTGKIEIVNELPCGGDKEKGRNATQDALRTNTDLAGIFAINDPAALGARAALETAGKADQIKIIGFDGQPEGKKAILDGKIYADPIQHPDQIARETAKAILRHFAGDPPPAQILIPTALYRLKDAQADPAFKK